MSQVQQAEANEQESYPSGGNSSTKESSSARGNVSSSEEESDGDLDIRGERLTCAFCGSKVLPVMMQLHTDLLHPHQEFVEEHVCIYCMAAFPDYFQMIAHQNQCLGNQL